jgi:hypothetical protein
VKTDPTHRVMEEIDYFKTRDFLQMDYLIFTTSMLTPEMVCEVIEPVRRSKAA